MKGQRKMVSDMVKAINEQSHRTPTTSQTGATRAVKKAPPRKTATAKKAPARKRTAVRA
jgi:hypothetical protein